MRNLYAVEVPVNPPPIINTSTKAFWGITSEVLYQASSVNLGEELASSSFNQKLFEGGETLLFTSKIKNQVIFKMRKNYL